MHYARHWKRPTSCKTRKRVFYFGKSHSKLRSGLIINIFLNHYLGTAGTTDRRECQSARLDDSKAHLQEPPVLWDSSSQENKQVALATTGASEPKS
jgi:hypothetical protein